MGMKLRDRDPVYQCWRVAAIYRCVLRYDKGRDWALQHLRALDPTGRKDHLVDVWFMGGIRILPQPDKAGAPLPQIALAA